MPPLTAPFPYFGGKKTVAPIVWSALGNPYYYIEPFCGSAAVLLARPHKPSHEIIGDLDCFLVNFWRAMKHGPDLTASYADHLNSQADMNARHKYLIASKASLSAKIKADPEYYDAKCAGYWVYGASLWIGSGWTKSESDTIQHLHHPQGIFTSRRRDIAGTFQKLSLRLRNVAVVNSSWEQTCSTPSTIDSDCGVFFDPPYSAEAGRDNNIYANEDLSVAHDVRAWCIQNENRCKIVLAGYEGEHNELQARGWRVVAWKAKGGYAHNGKKKGAGDVNRHRERLWISPRCETAQGSLY